MKSETTIKLKNKKEQINLAQEEITEFCAKQNLSNRIKHDLNLIIDELFSNTILYAYDDNRDHFIVIKLVRRSSSIKIIYTDDGVKFNPTKYSEPSHLSKSLDEKPIGGLGLHLINKFTDRMEYRRKGNKNIITLEKTITPKSQQQK